MAEALVFACFYLVVLNCSQYLDYEVAITIGEKMKLYLLLLIAFNCIAQHASAEVEFVILITSYNNEKYALDNLKSVCYQKASKPYQVICINDCSRDKTKDILNAYVREYHLESFVTLIHNEKRVGALANIYTAIHSYIPDHKVVVSVDGDDALAHDEVLLRLEKAYQNQDIWLTWGQAQNLSDGVLRSKELPKEVWTKKKLRTSRWVTSHLRTFKAGLFKKIEKSDLLYDNEFFPMAWDLAIMFPMLEMCAPLTEYAKPHCLFIPEVLYRYNDLNEIGDSYVNGKLQYQLAKVIRKRKPYAPLKMLNLR